MLVLLCMALTTATAKSVVFTLKNGTLVYYLLGGETAPMLRFVDGKATINADEYTISNIKNFYISATDDPNAIENVLTEQDISYTGNTLVVKASSTKGVKVFGTNGSEVKADIQQSGDIITVNLNNLERGAYVISTGDSSFKVMKK